MEDKSSPSNSNSAAEPQSGEPPAPEVLKPQDEVTETPEFSDAKQTEAAKTNIKDNLRRRTYRPSHRATFIGLGAIAGILIINAVVIGFVLRSQSKTKKPTDQVQLSVSQDTLNKLGVSRNAVGDSGTELVVNPNARFVGNVDIGGNVSIAGNLQLNNKFSANEASFIKLQAGNTTLTNLNVNTDATISTLNLRQNLNVAGSTRLQGAVTVGQLLTVNNSLNVTGNLAVGGVLSIGKLSTNSFAVGGHITTFGSVPSVSRGSCIGSNGTVSVSGNDTSGTVAINVGAGGCAGTLLSLFFRSAYGSTPHVVVSPVNRSLPEYYVTRNSGGFTIGTNSAPAPTGYAFDYIVEQ